MKVTKSMILVVMVLLCFVSCANNTHQNTSQTNDSVITVPQTTAPTAYEMLSENEKMIFDGLIIAINSKFKSPSSVRVLAAGHILEELSTIELKISSTNTMGGTVTQTYYLVYDDATVAGTNYFKGTIMKSESSNFQDAGDIDCSKINKAIAEYFINLGY